MAAPDRVLPCLLDRLISSGNSPGIGTRISAAATLRNYQQSVLRDLNWLLNANATMDETEAAEFPEVGRSVLNYGTRDFCGVTASSINVSEVERELTEAIRLFEPRIIPSTLAITALPPADNAVLNLVAFEIRAEVWAVPFPEQVFIRTELDLETGQYQLR
jgi:type VI secretion system protein ImpF